MEKVYLFLAYIGFDMFLQLNSSSLCRLEGEKLFMENQCSTIKNIEIHDESTEKNMTAA